MREIWKHITAAVGVLAGFASIYAMAITFFGVTIRPAWSWEVAELNLDQKEYQYEFYQFDRRYKNAQLYENRKLQREYVNAPKPEWLIKEERDLEQDVKEIDNKMFHIQQEILNLKKDK